MPSRSFSATSPSANITRPSTARLISAIEQVCESIVITDPDGNIVYVNPAFERITGYSREEALGKNPSVLKSGRHSREFYAQLWSTLKAGEAWSGRFTNRAKDGASFVEEATIAPVFDRSGTIVNFVAVKRDVTQETELHEQLHQSQKMDAIGRLAGGVAHDFNNMLMVIVSYAELLANSLPENDPLRSHTRRSCAPPSAPPRSPASCWPSAASRCWRPRFSIATPSSRKPAAWFAVSSRRTST